MKLLNTCIEVPNANDTVGRERQFSKNLKNYSLATDDLQVTKQFLILIHQHSGIRVADTERQMWQAVLRLRAWRERKPLTCESFYFSFSGPLLDHLIVILKLQSFTAEFLPLKEYSCTSLLLLPKVVFMSMQT